MEPDKTGNKSKVVFWTVAVLVSTAIIGGAFAYNSFYRKDKEDKSKKLKIVK